MEIVNKVPWIANPRQVGTRLGSSAVYLAAGVFLFSGGSKLLVPAQASPIGTMADQTLGVVELVLAALLLCCRRIMLVRKVSVALAAAFVGASTVGLGGAQSCGCFGRVDVAPLDRLLLAGIVLVALLVSCGTDFRPWRLALLLGIAAFVGGAIETTVQWRDRVMDPAERLATLLPGPLRHNDWSVLVVRANCPACYAYLQQGHWRDDAQTGRRALLVIGHTQPWLDSFAQEFDAIYSVSETRAIGIATPREIAVMNGMIIPMDSRAASHG